jgi:hypothetical protein
MLFHQGSRLSSAFGQFRSSALAMTQFDVISDVYRASPIDALNFFSEDFDRFASKQLRRIFLIPLGKNQEKSALPFSERNDQEGDM